LKVESEGKSNSGSDDAPFDAPFVPQEHQGKEARRCLGFGEERGVGRKTDVKGRGTPRTPLGATGWHDSWLMHGSHSGTVASGGIAGAGGRELVSWVALLMKSIQVSKE